MWHGLSIPALNLIYKFYGVEPIREDPVEIKRKSIHEATPVNAINGDLDSFVAYNRFSRQISTIGSPTAAQEPNDFNSYERRQSKAAPDGLASPRQGEKFQLGQGRRDTNNQVPSWVP